MGTFDQAWELLENKTHLSFCITFQTMYDVYIYDTFCTNEQNYSLIEDDPQWKYSTDEWYLK